MEGAFDLNVRQRQRGDCSLSRGPLSEEEGADASDAIPCPPSEVQCVQTHDGGNCPQGAADGAVVACTASWACLGELSDAGSAD